MDVQFVTSIAPIVRDLETSQSFYRDALGLTFEGQEGDWLRDGRVSGTSTGAGGTHPLF
jgi:catechol 2,3-dioxygenase-like lactoylglutathione lyase family enzyme